MIQTMRVSRTAVSTARRFFASDAPAKPAPRPGVGIFGRISSFLVGAGVTALGTQFYIYQELANGNKMILAKQKELEDRLAKLEK
eukprot:CAMPEP_0176091278 /NCGR_PEP_ID=MMETSP0120_2-20121206/45719_1 /TAXON_ID=160619 /ORGANISM="Kryptoperidinium foliaceum, Strain CCMP 1326" /LENGTH=84 /DNA_ID=CAMNT_0017425171 /DNA_START=64 /DNA_END=318 /DNA_ORIENTATION=+